LLCVHGYARFIWEKHIIKRSYGALVVGKDLNNMELAPMHLCTVKSNLFDFINLFQPLLLEEHIDRGFWFFFKEVVEEIGLPMLSL